MSQPNTDPTNVTAHQHTLELQQQLEQYNDKHKLDRPSIQSNSWTPPWKYNGQNTPLLIDITYNTLRTTGTLLSILYPSYLTFHAIETRNRKEQHNMLVYWTVSSVFNGLVSVADIWLHAYSTNTAYQVTSLALKLIPTVLTPERCYKLAIRPFYRVYVQKRADELIAELEEVQQNAKQLAEQTKERITELFDNANSDNNNKPISLTPASKHSNTKDKLLYTMPVSPSIDDMDKRMLNYTRSQVEDIDDVDHDVIVQLKPV